MEAEMGLLGAYLLDNSTVDDTMDMLQAQDFYRPSHGKLFQTMTEMRATGTPIDGITLRDALQSRGILDSVGGMAYIIDLQDTGISCNAKRYADIIRKYSKLRRIIGIGVAMTALGYDATVDDVDEAISEVMSMTTALSLAHTTAAVPVNVVLEDVIKMMKDGKRDYITPPSMPSVRILPGDLVVLSGGTSAGKTAVAMDWADQWSKTKNCVYFEYEMPEVDLTARLLCNHAGVEMKQIQDGDLTVDEVNRVEDAAAMLKNRNLKVEEVWCDVNSLFAKIRREAQQGAEIVFIDHLGLISFRKQKGENEAKAIGKYITNPLKRLASELGIRIVLLVQLNRDGQREGFPKLYNLRDSGEIEQDASIVIMLWSEKAVKDDQSARIKIREDSGIVDEGELFDDSFYVVRYGIEKNRNGALGHQYSKFYGANFRYVYPNEEIQSFSDKQLFGV